MTKIDVWARRPKTRRAPQTQTFQDIDIDGEPFGEPFTLTFEAIYDNSARALQEQSNFDRLAETYLPDETGTPPSEFPHVGGSYVIISEPLLRTACSLEAMQPEDLTERYDALEMVALLSQLHIKTHTEIVQFASDVNSKKK